MPRTPLIGVDSGINGPSGNWKTIKKKMSKIQSGVQHLFVVSRSVNPVSVDWLSFE